MDELLANFESDLGIEDRNDFSDEAANQIAKEINFLKQASESAMEVALKKEQSLQHGESIDQYMPTGNVVATMENIEYKKNEEIAALDKNADDFKRKKE